MKAENKFVFFDGRTCKLEFKLANSPRPLKAYFSFLSAENRENLKRMTLEQQRAELLTLSFDLMSFFAGIQQEEASSRKFCNFQMQKAFLIRSLCDFLFLSKDKKQLFCTLTEIGDILPYFIAHINYIYECSKQQFIEKQED